MGEQTARVLTEAVRSINNGIRGFYYAMAALFLFAGPYACIAATVLITGTALLPPALFADGDRHRALCRGAEEDQALSCLPVDDVIGGGQIAGHRNVVERRQPESAP